MNRKTLEFVGLVIAWPVLAYAVGVKLLEPYGNPHPDAAIALAISGMLAWAWRNH